MGLMRRPVATDALEGDAQTSDALLVEEDKGAAAKISGHAQPLTATVESVTNLCEALTQFGGLLLAVYVCEFFPLFAHSEKVWWKGVTVLE